MQYFQYIANDNARREREIQLARKYNQKPVQNTFRKPPRFKRSYYVIQWVFAITALIAALLFIFA